MKHYKVTTWVESDGEPEDDPKAINIVEACDKYAAQLSFSVRCTVVSESFRRRK